MELDTNYEEFEDDVGLGEEDKKHAKSNQLDWFKGEKNRTYRAAPVYFHPLEVAVIKAVKVKNPQAPKEEMIAAIQKVLAKRAEELGKAVDQLGPHEKLDITNTRFKKILAHYKEGVGYVNSRLGKDGPEADAVWKLMGDMKTYFTTALLIYPTNNEGELLKEQLATNWVVLPWRFSTKVYETLHQRRASLKENNISIASQDLKLKCTNTDFQNFDVDAAGPALWSKNPKFSSAVLAKAYPLYEKLAPFRDMSTADLKIKLGLVGGGSGTDVGVSDDEFNGLLDQV